MTASSEPEKDIAVIEKKNIILDWQKIQKIIQPLVLAVITGYVFNWFNVPVGWLVGSLVAGVVYTSIQSNSQPLPSNLITIGKTIIGISSAARFSLETLVLAKTYAIPLLLCILATGSLSMVNGYLISQWGGINRATSYLGSIPGSAASIVAMSEDFGADAVVVAILQYTRMMLVVLIVPVAVSFLSSTILTTQTLVLLPTVEELPPVPMVVNLVILTLCCYLGILLGKWLKFPNSEFLGSFMLGILVFWNLPYHLQVPPILFIIGLILMGVSIGLKFDWRTAYQLKNALLLEIALVIVFILCCFGIGYEFHLVTKVEIMTALLGFTPGGIEAMIGTVTHLGGDIGMVLAIQLTRQMLILLVVNALNLLLKKGVGEEVGKLGEMKK